MVEFWSPTRFSEQVSHIICVICSKHPSEGIYFEFFFTISSNSEISQFIIQNLKRTFFVFPCIEGSSFESIQERWSELSPSPLRKSIIRCLLLYYLFRTFLLRVYVFITFFFSLFVLATINCFTRILQSGPTFKTFILSFHSTWCNSNVQRVSKKEHFCFNTHKNKRWLLDMRPPFQISERSKTQQQQTDQIADICTKCLIHALNQSPQPLNDYLSHFNRDGLSAVFVSILCSFLYRISQNPW